VRAEHLRSRDMPFLQRVARALAGRAESAVTLLTAGEGNEGVFVLVASGGFEQDLKPLAEAVSAELRAKGGGKGAIYQGKARRLEARDAAAERLRTLT
jgi:alanyl-tRNA synthetase